MRRIAQHCAIIAQDCAELRRIAPELRQNCARIAPELRGVPIDSTVEMMKQMRIGKKYSGAKPIEKPSAVAMPFHRNVTGEFDDVRYLWMEEREVRCDV